MELEVVDLLQVEVQPADDDSDVEVLYENHGDRDAYAHVMLIDDDIETDDEDDEDAGEEEEDDGVRCEVCGDPGANDEVDYVCRACQNY